MPASDAEAASEAAEQQQHTQQLCCQSANAGVSCLRQIYGLTVRIRSLCRYRIQGSGLKARQPSLYRLDFFL